MVAGLNEWLAAAAGFMIALAVCGWSCSRGTSGDRLVALMFTGEISTLIFLVLAAGYQRDFYIDCALAAAILPYPSSIVFAHFFERWI